MVVADKDADKDVAAAVNASETPAMIAKEDAKIDATNVNETASIRRGCKNKRLTKRLKNAGKAT